MKILHNSKDNASVIKKIEKKYEFPENNPHSALVQQSKHKEMVSVMNVASIMENERPVKLEKTDFGSTFRRHPADYNRMYHLTTYMDSFTKENRSSTADNGLTLKSNKGAGLPVMKNNPENQKGPKVGSLLIGETLKNGLL